MLGIFILNRLLLTGLIYSFHSLTPKRTFIVLHSSKIITKQVKATFSMLILKSHKQTSIPTVFFVIGIAQTFWSHKFFIPVGLWPSLAKNLLSHYLLEIKEVFCLPGWGRQNAFICYFCKFSYYWDCALTVEPVCLIYLVIGIFITSLL